MPTSSKESEESSQGLKSLIYKSLKTPTVIAFLGLISVLVFVFLIAGRLIANSTSETLIAEARNNLLEITQQEASFRNEVFARVASYAMLLQANEELILANPKAFAPPNGPIQIATAKNGARYKTKNNGGGSLWIAASTPITPELEKFLNTSEAFDPLMLSVVKAMPDTIVAVYFNGHDNVNRYIPFLTNVHDQFGPELDLQSFNFYYVADAKHNPEGREKWTDVYLDPAGQGWMITCAVPIRKGGKIRGVTGIDVTLEKLRKSVVDLPLPAEGSALLVTNDGQILALGSILEGVFGLKELTQHSYQGVVQTQVLKPDEFQVANLKNPKIKDFLQKALLGKDENLSEDFVVDNKTFVVTKGQMDETNWQLFVFTPKDKLLAPLYALRIRSMAIMGIVTVIFLVCGFLVTQFLLKKSSEIGEVIATPLERLSLATENVGSSLSIEKLPKVGIAEIDFLSSHFELMSNELVDRQKSLLSAEIQIEKQKQTEELLLRVLPDSIAKRMMGGEKIIVDSYDSVSVIFADIAGFTPLAAKLDPRELLKILDQVFVAFDQIIIEYGIEKIKTIGDAYMAVAGIPEIIPDHVERAARVALAMRDCLGAMEMKHRLMMRIGIHSGPAIAGVIGNEKFLYDLWGDTVNVASRLESNGTPDRIQISGETARVLSGKFEIEKRGLIELKGKGAFETFWLHSETKEKKQNSTSKPIIPKNKRNPKK